MKDVDEGRCLVGVFDRMETADEAGSLDAQLAGAGGADRPHDLGVKPAFETGRVAG